MFHKISERIITYAIKNSTLDKDKADEYIYGLEITLSVLASYLSVIIIGLLMGMLWQSVLFLFLFVSVRRFAGGFHFSSQIMCYLSMCIMCSLVLLIIKYSENNVMLYSIIMTISIIILLMLSPVPAIEKPLDTKEKIIYGRIARIMIIVIAVIYAVLCFFEHIYIAKIIAITVCVIAIFVVLGKMKYKMYKGL